MPNKKLSITKSQRALIKLERIWKSGGDESEKAGQLVIYFLNNQSFPANQWPYINQITGLRSREEKPPRKPRKRRSSRQKRHKVDGDRLSSSDREIIYNAANRGIE